MDEQKGLLKAVVGLLATWKRKDLVRLLKRSKLYLEPSSAFGTHWHSILTTAILYSSATDCEELRGLNEKDHATILRALLEIYPPADNDYEISEIVFRIDPGAVESLDLGKATASRELAEILQEKDLASLEAEYQRAEESITVDPPTAVTAACAIFESFCRVYIEDEGLEMPKSLTVKPLWSAVQRHLDLSPDKHVDADLKRILSGLSSVVDGFASLRSHIGSVHGRGKKSYKVAERHARLAVNASHSLVFYLLETWDNRCK